MQEDHNGLCKPNRTNYTTLIKSYELFPNMVLKWKPPIYFGAMNIKLQTPKMKLIILMRKTLNFIKRATEI